MRQILLWYRPVPLGLSALVARAVVAPGARLSLRLDERSPDGVMRNGSMPSRDDSSSTVWRRCRRLGVMRSISFWPALRTNAIDVERSSRERMPKATCSEVRRLAAGAVLFIFRALLQPAVRCCRVAPMAAKMPHKLAARCSLDEKSGTATVLYSFAPDGERGSG